MKKDIQQKECWTNWQWQLANSIRKPEHLSRFFLIPPYIQEHLETFSKETISSFRLTPFLASLIHWEDSKDPILLQHLPQREENILDTFSYTEVWEQPEDFFHNQNRFIQQKYPDIILLRLTSTCHSFCRFCFEKERTLLQNVPTDTSEAEWKNALKIISESQTAYQVLLSGGDPLVLTDEVFFSRLRDIALLPNITIVRVNTRAWLHNPFRFTEHFISSCQKIIEEAWTKKPQGISLRFGVHANHPQEITDEAVLVFRRMRRVGVSLYNQTVLLKGINDSAEIIGDLWHVLRKEGVELHYFSHAMPVPGTKHFRTSVRLGQEILKELREKKEFRGALPQYELSFHKGKQMIPTSMGENFYEDVVEREGKKEAVIRFFSDITHAWEVYPDERPL